MITWQVKMSKSKILKALGLISITILFISACSSNNSVPNNQEESDENIADMANPAAVYCEGLGYSMENVIRNGGGDADCIFPDGSRCAQWDFLSGRCGQEFTYCKTQGYNLEEGANIGTCRFADNSTCDEFTFFSGECSPGDHPDVSEEDTIQILDFSEARDFIAEYFYRQYGIEQIEPWIEQNITPDGVVGSSTIRFVSGPLTIVISAPAAAPAPSVYTIEEASFIVNGFHWEGTLSPDGQIAESIVILPATILSEEQARDAVLEYIIGAYTLPSFGEWTDQGMAATDADTTVIVFASGPWVVEIEYAPAAPLISSYQVTVDNNSEGIRWEGDISLHGEIVEISFTK
jgi:putative hemolysin